MGHKLILQTFLPRLAANTAPRLITLVCIKTTQRKSPIIQPCSQCQFLYLHPQPLWTLFTIRIRWDRFHSRTFFSRQRFLRHASWALKNLLIDGGSQPIFMALGLAKLLCLKQLWHENFLFHSLLTIFLCFFKSKMLPNANYFLIKGKRTWTSTPISRGSF